ncbi:MAG TPA: DoxX family protein [Thermoanaerobaculia bacterium]|nr:DoxX family protein [Thermoanaerobaculia bacterium]
MEKSGVVERIGAELATLLVTGSPRDALPSTGILFARVFFGVTMIVHHGRPTLLGFLEDPAGYPDPIGLGPALSAALMTFAEVICALMVSVGIMTRAFLVPLIVGFFVAFAIHHAGDPFHRRELAWLYLILWSSLFITGPGRWSLDHVAFGRYQRSGQA